jgi:predicted DNA-binding protein
VATIQISDDLDRRLTQTAERLGKSKTEIIAEAIRLRFEEMEALARAEEHIKDIGESTSLKDLAIELGHTDSVEKPSQS